MYIFIKGVKWSPYENAAGCQKGVTEYAGGVSERFGKRLQKSLAKIVSVFRLPCADLTHRQANVLAQVINSPISTLGLALAMGENYHSSSHTGFKVLGGSKLNLFLFR